MSVYRADAHFGAKAYVLTSTLTVLIYDLLCTLDREVAYVWTHPWSVGTWLFMVNRYLPFVDTIIALKLMRSVTTPQMCRVHHIIFISILTGGILLSEAILMLRTYAMWNRRRWVLIILCLLATVICATLLGLLRVGERTYMFEPVVEYRYGCKIKAGGAPSVVFYVIILFSETVIVVLTMIKGAQDQHPSSSWVARIYKDGLLFYIYMLLITLANVAMSSIGKSPDEKNLLSGLQRAFHSIFCNRVILVILAQRRGRTVEAEGWTSDGSQVLSTIGGGETRTSYNSHDWT